MTPAVLALRAAGVAFTVHKYRHDRHHASYGLEAAEKLGVDAARVFKTLVASADGALVVGIVPVSGRLDLKAIARALGVRAVGMPGPDEAERATGYVAGGISPIGQRSSLPTVLDESALLFDTVFVSGGRRGLEVEIAPADLIEVTGAIPADIRSPGS